MRSCRRSSTGRVAFGVIDNAEELERLAALARAGAPVDVMLRINTGIEAHTHEFVRTGGENTKFGIARERLPAIAIRASRAAAAAADRPAFARRLADRRRRAAGRQPRRALIRVCRTRRALGLPVEELIVGGGIGVEGPDEPRPIDLEAFAGRAGGRAAGRPTGSRSNPAAP
jgi:diaminopimelate decarboxylase